MTDPLMTSFLFGVLAIISGAAFWPKYGIFARLFRLKKDKKRVLAEDCLKFLHDCEYRKISCSRSDVAKTFSLSTSEVEALLSSLRFAGLIQLEEDQIRLTEAGQRDARQIVRIHRLLERFLAEETGLKETEWHVAAEDKEHTISAEEANAMAAQLGNPVYDPHGDPIPTAMGEIPGLKGIPLSELKVGNSAKVVHIEDEPTDIYTQIVDFGFHLGTRVTNLGYTEGGIRLRFDGMERIVSPSLIGNITVLPLEAPEKIPLPVKLLSGLKLGESGKVIGISKACRGQQRRRLMDLGVVPGSIIKAEMKSVGKDPTAYLIRGALIALRKKQSDYVYIEDNPGR